MAKNTDLLAAKKNKNNEFYTQRQDIELELKHYTHHFKGKTVYCNCDDPFVSEFFRYFSTRFEYLGLKKLIATCYKSRTLDMFSQHDTERAVRLEYTGDQDGNLRPDPEEIGRKPLNGDGDFRSQECIEILKQADIVVTNPPFSLFRDYVAQLMEYDKKFLIIGHQGASSYKDIFPLIRDGKIWYGASIKSGDREFGIPDHYPLNAAGTRIDEEGNKYIRVKGVRWFTNLDYPQRYDELILDKKYNPIDYPKYENLDAIEVCPTANIPKDYAGVMGVPITFLDKHNPDQFEILGLSQGNLFRSIPGASGLSEKFVKRYYETGGKGIIKKDHPMLGYYKDGKAIIPYSRILIRNKNPQS